MCKRLPHDKTVVTFSDHKRAAMKQLYTIPCREVIMGSGGGVFGGRVFLRRKIRHKLINCDISQVYHITWDENNCRPYEFFNGSSLVIEYARYVSVYMQRCSGGHFLRKLFFIATGRKNTTSTGGSRGGVARVATPSLIFKKRGHQRGRCDKHGVYSE